MKKCCICKKELGERDLRMPLSGGKLSTKWVCSDCSNKIDMLYNSRDKEQKEDLCFFFYEKAFKCNDSIVQNHLLSVLKNIGYPKAQYFFHSRMHTKDSGWVVMLRTLTGLLIFVGILTSIFASIPFFRYGNNIGLGFLIILGGPLVTLLLFSWNMIVLNIASDLRAIRQMIKDIPHTT